VESIKKVSKYVTCILRALIYLLPLAIIFHWVFLETQLVQSWIKQGFIVHGPISDTMGGYIHFSNVKWSVGAKLFGFLSSAIRALPVLLGLCYLQQIFSNYQRGEVFNTINAQYYKKLGILFFIDALLAKPISDLLLTWAVTCNNPSGMKLISIGFGTDNRATLISGLLISTISCVMYEASKLEQEQKFTI
jgi:hypothetical protein